MWPLGKPSLGRFVKMRTRQMKRRGHPRGVPAGVAAVEEVEFPVFGGKLIEFDARNEPTSTRWREASGPSGETPGRRRLSGGCWSTASHAGSLVGPTTARSSVALSRPPSCKPSRLSVPTLESRARPPAARPRCWSCPGVCGPMPSESRTRPARPPYARRSATPLTPGLRTESGMFGLARGLRYSIQCPKPFPWDGVTLSAAWFRSGRSTWRDVGTR